MTLLQADNLAVGYDSTPVVRGISFAVEAGDYLCIVGENGSGKTTLMKTLLGLQDPIEGRIIRGENLGKDEIGYLPQQTQIQKDFPASVREVVLSGCQAKAGFRPFYNRQEKETAARNMERMGIAELADRCYRDLSGGQQQRVLLARALCAAEKILLLDEPVSGLDPKVTAEMYALIRQLNEDGVTILMISHDIDEALGFATHILHVSDHVFFGTREAFLSSEEGRRFTGWEGGTVE
ncbi:MAG: metal ABC transporter ATP-binding protein [Firmicutes bacterium]|nr:metal ABC transporter ATP-binding protein [Bacillota bacterium]